jgi:threonine synthase
MTAFHFKCGECGRRYSEAEVRYVCPPCGARREPGRATRGVLAVELDGLPRGWPEAPLSAPEALAAFLPVRSAASIPPLAVGGTPLLPVPRLRAEVGLKRLWVKDETRNPSGSIKDRASLLVVAKALEYGCETVACASTGNAASSLAAAAAAAGVCAVVFVPASAPPAKLVQSAAYGARLVAVQGSYDEAFELALACCERFGWYNRNTAYNPFTIEGKKTAALEIVAAMSPEAPDAVVVPVGDGVVIAGMAKGFADLTAAGILARSPRLIAVQPEGSAAIVRALRAGAEEVSPVTGAGSVADSLVVEAPRNGPAALKAVRGSGGTGVIVSDDAIIAAVARLAATTGVFAEPAGAASLAGLEAALAERILAGDERIVLLVTGSGLKDVDAASRAMRVSEPVEPSVEAVEKLLSER